MSANTNKKNNGFTLLEILVAVAIIAIIIAMAVPNFMGFRERARDARRKSDLSQIQKALEIYKSDQNPPNYPDNGFMDGLCNQCWSQLVDCTGNIYMRKLPCDPKSNNPYYFNKDGSDNLRYTLFSCLENTEDPNEDQIGAQECADMGRESYSVNEP